MTEKERNITILKIEPHKEPEVISIPDTLHNLQNLVQGHLEAVSLSSTACIIVNEEGKLPGLKANRRFQNDVLAGNILIVGRSGSEIVSLTAEQIKQYTEQFKYPETISIEEVRAASKYHVITF